jgi:predicted GNAT family acetyltransferase
LAPHGRGRVAGEQDHEQVVRWCREFCTNVGETASIDAIDAGSWADTRFADKHFTFWETPDGKPVSMAGSTSMVAGMVRVDPVSTPAPFRGRGYAGAVTVEVSRAAAIESRREGWTCLCPWSPSNQVALAAVRE